jgi:hypothetical protein
VTYQSEIVEIAAERDALRARLAEAERLLEALWNEYPWGCAPDTADAVQAYLKTHGLRDEYVKAK